MTAYIGPTPVPQAVQRRETFTATAGQTSFATAGYQPGYILVFLNGVMLPAEDYTATNGSDVVLATGAAAGDVLETVAFTPFQAVDQAFTGDSSMENLDVTGLLSVSNLKRTAAPSTLEASDAEFNSSSNTYSTVATFTAPEAGFWKFTIFASVLTASVAGKIQIEHNGSTWHANAGYENDVTALFREVIIETDGVNDVLFQAARNDAAGTVTMRGLRCFGVKL